MYYLSQHWTDTTEEHDSTPITLAASLSIILLSLFGQTPVIYR